VEKVLKITLFLLITIFTFDLIAAENIRCSALFKKVEITKFVATKVDWLRSGFAKTFEDYLNDSENKDEFELVYLSNDSLECRFCVGFSFRLLPVLKENFYNEKWDIASGKLTVNTNNEVIELPHTYIISTSLNLIIDPTFRQVFHGHTSPSEMSELPLIFVGTADDFYKIAKPYLTRRQIKDYLPNKNSL